MKNVPSSQAGTWQDSRVWWKLKGAGESQHKVSGNRAGRWLGEEVRLLGTFYFCQLSLPVMVIV